MRPITPFLLSLLLLSATTFAGWSSSGPTGGAMSFLAVAPSDAKVIWAANSAGVYHSTDGGATWSDVTGPLTDVAFIAVHPNNANKVWAWSQTKGVYRTDDGGATWTALNALANTYYPTSFFIDPHDPDTLYASGNCYATIDVALVPGNGAFKSTDGGATWKAMGSANGPSICVAEMAIDPFSPWRLFATGVFGSRAESYDRGQTWQNPNDPRPSRAVLFDPRFPYTHYGINSYYGDFFESQDGGFTWITRNAKLPARPQSLTIDPQRGRLFLGTVNGLFRSGDGGRVWAGTQLPASNVAALDFTAARDVLFAATDLGLFEVGNHGLGEPRRIDLHDIASNIATFDVDPGDGRFLYAVTNDARFYRSTDGGASWEQLPFDDDVVNRRVSVGADGTVYAVSRALTLYRRGRNDDKWTVVRRNLGSSAFGPDTLAADPVHPGTLYVAGCCGIERSRDFGATWTPTGIIGNSVSVSRSDPQFVYIANTQHIYRSSDGGSTWVDIPRDYTAGLFAAPSKGRVLYRVGAVNGFERPERSDDGGVTWRTGALPGGQHTGTLAIDPRDDSSVWAAADPFLLGSGIFHSTDGGATWTEVPGPFGARLTVTAIRFDPSGGAVSFATAAHGVWTLTGD